MKRRVACMVGAAVFLSCVSAAPAETLDAAIKAIVDKTDSHQSEQGRIISTQRMENPQTKLESQADTIYECLKKDGTWLYRSETRSKSTSAYGGQEMKQQGTTLVVFDGEYVWTLSEMGGQKIAMKNRSAADSPFVANKAYFDNFKQSFELKLLPDEKVDGKAAWVIQATPRQPAQKGMVAVLLVYFDKDTGINVKTVGKDSSGKEVMTSSTRDVKFDSPPSADRFTFKVPDGVQVVDMTQQPGQSEAQPAGAKPEEPKQPPPQPKKEGHTKKPGLKLPKLP